MKKILFSLIAIVAISQSTYAQWTTSGTNIYNANTGNVGIGTTSPLTLFNVVVPNAKTTASGSIATFLSTNEVGSAAPFGLRTMIFGASALSSRYITLQTTDYNLTDGGNIILEPAAGSVGIGTTTPTAPLNVQGGSTTTGLANIATTLTTRFNTANPPVTLGIGYVSSDNPFLQAFNSTNNTANNLIMNPFGGNVLIGQSSQHNSAYMLDVNGTVRAKSITVNTDGADFVFEPSYKLNTLPALKDYINKNHHLPEIASAKEMQKDGLNVGENQVKLLQKVEELTLYLIDENNTVENQKATNRLLMEDLKLQSEKIEHQAQQSKNQTEQLNSQQTEIDQLRHQLASILKHQSNQ